MYIPTYIFRNPRSMCYGVGYSQADTELHTVQLFVPLKRKYLDQVDHMDCGVA